MRWQIHQTCLWCPWWRRSAVFFSAEGTTESERERRREREYIWRVRGLWQTLELKKRTFRSCAGTCWLQSFILFLEKMGFLICIMQHPICTPTLLHSTMLGKYQLCFRFGSGQFYYLAFGLKDCCFFVINGVCKGWGWGVESGAADERTNEGGWRVDEVRNVSGSALLLETTRL